MEETQQLVKIQGTGINQHQIALVIKFETLRYILYFVVFFVFFTNKCSISPLTQSAT